MPNVVPASASRPEASSRAPRKNLFLTATLAVGGVARAVRVRNLSASGALVEGAKLPATGVAAILQRGGISADCAIVWQVGGRGGLHFTTPIDLSDWVPGASGDGQASVDRPATATPIPDASPDIDPGLLRRTADELAFVSRRLDALGSDLTNDVHVVMRHATSLQELDISMQILGHLATMLAADRPADAVAAIGMTDLRRRLQRTTTL